MNELEEKYALFRLSEEVQRRLLQLSELRTLAEVGPRRFVVETVVVQDGKRKVISKEERGG